MASSAANTIIGIIKEVTPGTTPNTPTLASQRFSSANFSVTKPELLDDSKASTRQYMYTQTGNKTVGGSLSGKYAYDNYDLLMESCFYNTFQADVLKMGNAIQSLTIEESQPDATTFFRVNKGMIVNSMTINAPVDGLASCDFEFVGLSQSIDTSSVSASSYSAQTASEPFMHCSGTIFEGGSPIAIATDINFTINNNLDTVHTWGSCDPYSLVPARIDVTGTLTVLLESGAMLNKFLTGAKTSLKFRLENDEGESHEIFLPHVKYTTGDAPIEPGSGVRAVSMAFRAVYDPSSASTVVITRDDGT